MGGTLEDLKNVELCYAPLFSTAKDVVNYAALVGLNLLNNTYRQVHVSQVRELVENNACIVDVREKREFEQGHLINAVNIPLSELRDRMDEIPKDKPVYVHCLTGQRSYNAVLALQGHGYNNVYNISGSFLGICANEYYLDNVTGRKQIVTAYKFDLKN
jgi:rhodanese-related sulfurtransferase